MKLENVDGFTFDFSDAIAAFIFDEKDREKDNFHGAPMKAVDIIVELEDKYYFIEIKEFPDAEDHLENQCQQNERITHLKKYLKYKYRDTYLYRHAEGKVDKDIHYICLLNFDNALCSHLGRELQRELPVGIPRNVAQRWQQAIAKSCHVVNLNTWNRNFGQTWPVKKCPDTKKTRTQ